MKIKHITVNGETYEIEAQNNMILSINEPIGENRLDYWLKYSGIRNIIEQIGFETSINEFGSRLYYSIDELGNLLSQTSNSGMIVTKMFGLFKNMQYRLYLKTSYTFSSTYTINIHFYDVNKQYLSKKNVVVDSGISHQSYTIIDTFELPENACYVRFEMTSDYSELFNLAENGADISEDNDYNPYGYSNNNIKIFKLDNDHYVEV